MDYLVVTSLLIAACFATSALLFSAVVVRRPNDWIGDLSRLGLVASVAGLMLYALNLAGVWPTPIPAYIGRPIVFMLALFVLVVAIAFYRRTPPAGPG